MFDKARTLDARRIPIKLNQLISFPENVGMDCSVLSSGPSSPEPCSEEPLEFIAAPRDSGPLHTAEASGPIVKELMEEGDYKEDLQLQAK